MAGMNEESREFAGNLFDALARERGIKGDSINKAQLKEFWDQISDQSFDSRLRTFIDMLFFFFYSIKVCLNVSRRTIPLFFIYCLSLLIINKLKIKCRVDKDADGRITEVEIREVWHIGCRTT